MIAPVPCIQYSAWRTRARTGHTGHTGNGRLTYWKYWTYWTYCTVQSMHIQFMQHAYAWRGWATPLSPEAQPYESHGPTTLPISFKRLIPIIPWTRTHALLAHRIASSACWGRGCCVCVCVCVCVWCVPIRQGLASLPIHPFIQTSLIPRACRATPPFRSSTHCQQSQRGLRPTNWMLSNSRFSIACLLTCLLAAC